MKMENENEWDADDATWKLLGEAETHHASARFADDALRAVKLLPEADPWWPKVLSFSPWGAVAVCGVLAAFTFIHSPYDDIRKISPMVTVSAEEKWVAIAEVADAEMLAAAADDLDSFSDQELVSLVGF